jgi:dienelactone hydrolase
MLAHKTKISLFIISMALMIQSCAFAKDSNEIILPRKDGKSTPIRLYGNWQNCSPTLILSHGLGGSNKGLYYIANAAAKNGYRVAVMGHAESGGGRTLMKTFLTRKGNREKALLNPVSWQGRFDDLDATLSYATQNCQPPQLILGGHSMGAATTMLEAGTKGTVNYGGKNRFDAYIALSPQGVSPLFNNTNAWKNITKPVLLITGTEDDSFTSDYKNRVKAFDYMPSGYKRIVIIDGASHMDLGGRGNEKAQEIVISAIFDYLNMLQNNSWQAVQYPNAIVKDK